MYEHTIYRDLLAVMEQEVHPEVPSKGTEIQEIEASGSRNRIKYEAN